MHNIFWQNEEIRISQNKTGKELSLPLLPIVGNALADYILNERPKTCSNHLFVRAIEPFSQLSMTGLTNIIKRSAKGAHIETCYQRPTGIKSFRRSVGLNLLEQNTSANLIREILGHQSENAIRSYLAIDINHLKKCGFSLLGIEVKRKELFQRNNTHLFTFDIFKVFTHGASLSLSSSLALCHARQLEQRRCHRYRWQSHSR